MTKEVKIQIRKLFILNMKIIVTMKDKKRNGRAVIMKMMAVTSPVVQEVEEYSERDMVMNDLTVSRRKWISRQGESLLSYNVATNVNFDISRHTIEAWSVLFADSTLHKILLDTNVEFARTTATYEQKNSSTGKTTMHN
jgi:hypothetical protein